VVKELQGLFDASLDELVGTSRTVRHLDLALDRRLATHIVPQLLRAYDLALRRYDRAKRERTALDFDDLEWGALQLLREQASVLYYWRQEVQALLVDEFQDTNARQRDLLDLISGGPGKLFVVGDGKQSIYRFRGADVTVYRQKRQEISARGQTFDLATSYRAHRGLIAGLNALLEPVLGVEEDASRPYVEPFAPLAPFREAPAQGLRPPFIELHLALGTKREGALEQAARALAHRLRDLVEGSGVQIAEAEPSDRGGLRPLNYGDVAILCRASSSFVAYEDALDEAGVPYTTVAGRGFYHRPEVRDVLNALQALSDPTDDLALAGLLRSPACGMSDMALYRLSESRRDLDQPSLWATLCGGDLAALEGEADLAARCRELIYELHAMVGRATVADVLKAYLDRTDYQAALLRAGQARGARNVGKLLSDAQTSDMVGVGAFLEYVEQLRDVGTREGEAHTVSTGAVQVMSVHAAKGLEFPVVVIGDAGHGMRGSQGPIVDPDLGVLLPFAEEGVETDDSGGAEPRQAVSAIYRVGQQRAQDQEEAESDRLLYVAATRARELLLISGLVGRGPTGWLKRLDGALCLSEHQPADQEVGYEAVASLTIEAGGQQVACTWYPVGAELPPFPAVTASEEREPLPMTLSLLRSLASEPLAMDQEAVEAERDPPRRVWRVVPGRGQEAAPSWVVGKIVHGALERWLFPSSGEGGFERWATAEARACGITDKREIRDGVRRAARNMARFQATALYEQMAAASQRYHEVPYSVIDEQGRLGHGVIDALFRDEEGSWALVEFKTDRIRDQQELERKLSEKDYVPQVARYVAAAERLLGVRPRPVLCLLNCFRAVHVVEDRW
jgi:ATP-dependent exoDNAse (exonuclease V) beta subunit